MINLSWKLNILYLQTILKDLQHHSILYIVMVTFRNLKQINVRFDIHIVLVYLYYFIFKLLKCKNMILKIIYIFERSKTNNGDMFHLKCFSSCTYLIFTCSKNKNIFPSLAVLESLYLFICFFAHNGKRQVLSSPLHLHQVEYLYFLCQIR